MCKNLSFSFYLLFVDGLPRLVTYYRNSSALVVGKVAPVCAIVRLNVGNGIVQGHSKTLGVAVLVVVKNDIIRFFFFFLF